MSTDSSPDKVVEFLRARDYKLVRSLGEGACGKTVLLHDDYINAYFVCKKYSPNSEDRREELFAHFVKEVGLLHRVYHQNVVRVYNYYLYPHLLTGYILMEHVDGSDIDKYVSRYPEKINELFLQSMHGFAYLERQGILHRDIRPGNIMVREDGVLKIIDLGFGKRIETPADFEKSISLNWWCEPPEDFGNALYDFSTEVYFVGKLFEGLLRDHNIGQFGYPNVLRAMCQRKPTARPASFTEVARRIRTRQFPQIAFAPSELAAYRAFADALGWHVIKMGHGANFVENPARIVNHLTDVYHRIMLEETVPDSAAVLRCFVAGPCLYKKSGLKVKTVERFLNLLRSASGEKARVILANLHSRLATIPRYTHDHPPPKDDIPF